MAKNKLSDLRDHLFETLEMLKDKDKPMDIERARAVRDVAQVIVNSAKVEVDFLEATGELPTAEFFGPKLNDELTNDRIRARRLNGGVGGSSVGPLGAGGGEFPPERSQLTNGKAKH